MEIKLTPAEQLKETAAVISHASNFGLESFEQFAQHLQSALPEIVHAFTHLSFTNKDTELRPLKSDQKAFLAKIQPHSYLELRQISAWVPEGFCGLLTTYLDVLQQAVTRCTRLQSEVLNPYVLHLGEMVSRHDALLSSDAKQAQFIEMQATRDDLYKKLHECFQHGIQVRQPLGHLIERNSDWPAVLQKLNTVIGELEGIDRHALKALVGQAEDYLGVLRERGEKGELVKVSPEATKALVDGAYQIALEVEFFSLVYYSVLALRGSMDNTIEEIERVLAK